jgi:hypothetical protein
VAARSAGSATHDSAGKLANALVGLAAFGIFRWNTGLPTVAPFDEGQWATNWDMIERVTNTSHSVMPEQAQGLFRAQAVRQCNVTAIYQSLRPAYPGESGHETGFVTWHIALDLGFGKTWKCPGTRPSASATLGRIQRNQHTAPHRKRRFLSRTGCCGQCSF